MKQYSAPDIRNVCFVGSQGEGKTMLAEALLFNAGVINRMGRIEDGNTVCDSTPEEIERKISITLSVVFYEYQNKKINMLVTPGYPDFIGEVSAGLSVSDSAVFMVGADTGINPIGENIWDYLNEYKIPSIIVLNKIDKENININQIIKQLKDTLNNQIIPITIPKNTGQGVDSVINLLDDNVPDNFKQFKDDMIEAISSSDDALTEKYLDGKEITQNELKQALKKAIMERKIFPLLSTSVNKNVGIKELSDFIIEYLPAPVVDISQNNTSLLVFKTVSEPGMGQLNFVRLYSGSIETGKDIYNFTRNNRERIGQLCFTQGKKKIDTTKACAGDIVALLKLKDARTNDILGDEKHQPSINRINFPESIYHRAIITQSKGEEEKVGTALSIMVLENPTIKYNYNPETKQMVVSGMGALQLEVMAHKIKSRFGVNVELQPPRVPYKETVHSKAEVQGKYKRQSGGRGQYGDCWLRIEPLERGKGFEFVDKIVGGVIPKNYIPAVEKGVREAMEQGVIAGYPVTDIKVTVYDGSYHEVDSSDMAFKIAGAMALRKGVSEAKPVILEPIMNMEIIIPEEYMGTVMGDLNSRRGRVAGMDKIGKKQLIRALIPMSEIFQYATDLRSMTKGSGKFSAKISHYEEAPPHISQQLIETFNRSKTEENEK